MIKETKVIGQKTPDTVLISKSAKRVQGKTIVITSVDEVDFVALSPLDGRYSRIRDELGPYLSEFALVRERVNTEVQWLLFLIKNEITGTICPSNEDLENIRAIADNFSMDDMRRVKVIEAVRKHDVKSVEYFIDEKLDALGLGQLKSFVHLGCTSEDITSTAHACMLQEAMEIVWIPQAEKMLSILRDMTIKYANIPMLAHTHGQPATPTTVGKELGIYLMRLKRSLSLIQAIVPYAKFGGATGNYAAISIAYPEEDWDKHAKEFLCFDIGVDINHYTNQIEDHDWIVRLMTEIHLFTSISKNLCTDMWQYISRGYFKQIPVAGEVGSSTMPNKVNPINYENAEGNFEAAGKYCQLFMEELPLSRLQRDLTDSTTLRNLGMPLGHSLQSLYELERGLKKVEVNETLLATDLDAHWEVLAEAVQTILRKNGHSNAYEIMKEMTRGKDFSEEDYKAFVSSLGDKISESDLKVLSELRPASYTGYAYRLTKEIATYCDPETN